MLFRSSWYQYDSSTDTYQKKESPFSSSGVLDSKEYIALENSYIQLKKEYQSVTQYLKNIMYILIGSLGVLSIAFVGCLLHFLKKANDSDMLEEKVEKKKKAKPQVSKKEKSKKKEQKKLKEQNSISSKTENDIEVVDFNDED